MDKRATVFETYRFYDPVIAEHVEGEVAGKYAEERDPSILALPPDAKPILFRCRVLTRSQRTRIEELSDSVRLVAAFRFGILGISDIPEHGAWTPRRSKETGQIDEAALDELEAMGFGDVDFREIGAVVVARSFLAHGAPPYCPQLRSSQLAWVATKSRFLAAQSPDE